MKKEGIEEIVKAVTELRTTLEKSTEEREHSQDIRRAWCLQIEIRVATLLLRCLMADIFKQPK